MCNIYIAKYGLTQKKKHNHHYSIRKSFNINNNLYVGIQLVQFTTYTQTNIFFFLN